MCVHAGYRKDKIMRNIFETEMKDRFAEIEELVASASAEETKAARERIAVIPSFARIARSEGLLSLEENVQEKEGDPAWNYLAFICKIVVSGASLERLEEQAREKYALDGYTGYEGLLCALYTLGIMEMQECESPAIIEEKLVSLLPDDMRKFYEGRKKKKTARKGSGSRKKSGKGKKAKT